jgi:hypothetical protein
MLQHAPHNGARPEITADLMIGSNTFQLFKSMRIIDCPFEEQEKSLYMTQSLQKLQTEIYLY